MSVSGWEQLLFIVAVTAVAAPLLGRYLAATFRGAGATGSTAPGDRVFHQKFGYGRVTGVEGNKLSVVFETAGEKKVIDNFVSRA